ncbi:MAG: extracellular solute-binding protein [Clostridia bacterium]|nr:extracellular solute-binding protein [Clostridia bacterium]
MKITMGQRLAALILALVMLLCGGTFVASADDGTDTQTDDDRVDTTTNISVADYAARLNAISYEEYLEKYANCKHATSSIEINALDYDPEKTDAEVSEVTYDGVTALHTPANGSVSWVINLAEKGVTETTLYSIVVDYYPEEGKSASIEREFYINGVPPFSEAYSLTMPKIWRFDYIGGNLDLVKGENVSEYTSKAAELGLKYTTKDLENGTRITYEMPEYWNSDIDKYLNDEIALRFFRTDGDNNELRPTALQAPEWTSFEFRDNSGYYSETFIFAIEPDEQGMITFSLEGVNEPMAIKSIRLVPHAFLQSYEEYLNGLGSKNKASDVVKIEAEYPSATSTNTIYPVEERSSAANSPTDVTRMVLNTIGGEKWQTSGQWIEYKFRVKESGMYQILARFKQSILDGIFTSRNLYIFSDGAAEGTAGYYNGIPFKEATELRFNYSTDWQAQGLTNGRDNDGDHKVDNTYEFYFEKGVTYTVRFEVTLGAMGEVIQEIEKTMNSINADYLNIIKLTGSNPDTYRDYNFSRVMPDTLIDMIIQSRRLTELIAFMEETAGTASSNTATLEKVSIVLDRMGKDEDEIAKSLETLKTYIGNMGTFLSDAKTQPLMLDYLVICGTNRTDPNDKENYYKLVGKAGFFKSLGHELKSFFQSFVRDYNNMGSVDAAGTDASIEVWVAYGRDQSQVIRNLITNEFTPESNIAADLKLVSGGTLLPSILAGKGPDVYLGLGQGDVINYAIRGALESIENMEGFNEVITQFTDAAMLVLGVADSKNVQHYYGLPEVQGFPMMFVRVDILANLGIEIPKTWTDIYDALVVLDANKMEIGVTTDYKIFLYQNGGELFADNGMRINLDSQVGLDAFETMCNMFTMYSFPYSYNAANRFRTGEMPICIQDYTGMYNQLKVFATEIDGLWTFAPLPGIEDENGNINNCSISGVTADVIVTGSRDKDSAWKYLQWYTGPSCQTKYANEMVAIMGDSAKHNTANKNALFSMPWTVDEYEEVFAQFNNLASVPNYPGTYIIDRYTGFAFLAAYNKDANPVSELLSYINTINKEISRKRKEFDLETLEIGQTLASKRIDMVSSLFELLAKKSSNYDNLIEEASLAMANAHDLRSKVEAKYIVSLEDYSKQFLAHASRLDPTGSIAAGEADVADGNVKNEATIVARIGKYLQDAADALKTY